MRALLPPLPGSEPLDRRIAAVFIVLTAALLAPSVPGVFQPVARGDLANDRQALLSDVRQIVATVDAHEHATEPYYRTSLEAIRDRVDQLHEELDHRSVEGDARAARDEVAAAAESLATAADELARDFGDPAGRAKWRAEVEAVAHHLEALAT